MGKKQFHTRLDDDTAEWVDEFREKRNVTQAEAIRRLVRAGQEEYRRDDSDDDESDETEREARADGAGGVTRSLLHDVVQVYALTAIFASVLYYVEFLGFAEVPVLTLPELLAISLSALVVLLLPAALLYTRVPEKVDRALYDGGRRARRVLTPRSS